MSPSSTRMAALAVFAALILCGCARTGEAARDERTLRVYQVPSARTEALGKALNDVFWTGKDEAPVGKASSRVPGQLLVLAPDAMHASIDETLGKLASGTAQGSVSASNVQLRFWLIDAVPESAGGSARPAPAPVVESLRREFPGQAFRVHDQAQLGIRGMDGNGSLRTRAGTEIRARVGAEGNGLLADLEIVTETESGHSPLQTKIALTMDEYIVLAVTGGSGGDDAPQRIVVVQATSG